MQIPGLILMLTMPLAVRAADPLPLPFVEIPGYTIPAPPANYAQVVILEPLDENEGYFPVYIFRMDGEQRTLLSVTGSRTRSVVNLPPGKHLMMASHGGFFMEANVDAGKRYFVLLQCDIQGRVRMRPIRASGTSKFSIHSPDFARWIEAADTFVKMSPTAEEYLRPFEPDMRRVQQKGLKRWLALSAESAAAFTLNAEDAAPL
jgi:hypothetical protein